MPNSAEGCGIYIHIPFATAGVYIVRSIPQWANPGFTQTTLRH